MNHSGQDDPRIVEVMEIIAYEFAKDLSIESLAKRVHLSPSRLAHLFKSFRGVSIMGYLRLVRLRRAADLLKTTDLGVKVIMASVGMSDLSHFTRHFREQYGAPPAKYRKSYARRLPGRLGASEVA